MYFLALIAAAAAFYFTAVAFNQPRPAVILAAVLWALYVVYEILIYSEVLCGPKCNIRADLILLWPILMASSLFAVSNPRHYAIMSKVLAVIGLVVVVMLIWPWIYIAIFGLPF